MRTQVYFERDVYQEILEWKRVEDNTSLFLTGPRQVGKTYLLQKLGDEEFSHLVYINLASQEELTKLELLMNKYSEDNNVSRGFPWANLLKDFDAQYEENPNTLVVIDEIQESARWYNHIRPMTRELKSRLAVSGSYLGIARKALGYWEPAGDLMEVKMTSLSYVEFLKANGIYPRYSAITKFNLEELCEEDKFIYMRVQELYHVYCQIGGYPRVIDRWLQLQGSDSARIKNCLPIIDQILESFHRECRRYFPDMVSEFIWNRALQEIIKSIVTRDHKLGIEKGALATSLMTLELQPSGTYTMLRKDKVAVLRWLSDCHLIKETSVYDTVPFNNISNSKLRFYLSDLGILSRISSTLPELAVSDVVGVVSENFVHLYIHDQLGCLFINNDVRTYADTHSQAEIDFVMWAKNREIIGIEVKHSHGGTKSGDKALAAGHIKKLIKLQDTFGGIDGDKIVLPIFAIDKMPLLLNKGL